jgi:hypothetical protein
MAARNRPAASRSGQKATDSAENAVSPKKSGDDPSVQPDSKTNASGEHGSALHPERVWPD